MNMVFPTCQKKKLTLDNNNLQLLVDRYLLDYGDCYDREDPWWGDKQLTWEEALSRAWRSRLWNEKMHPHQYRVSKKLSQGLEVALADQRQGESFQDFQSVYDWVKSVVGRVQGLAGVTAYDVARRLGVWLSLKPVVVYLHGGTATGARKLGVEGEIAQLSVFPKEIQALGATHAENFLCIYKDRIS